MEVIVGFRVNLIFIFLYFKVVHCTGCMKMQVRVSETGEEEQVPMFLVGIGVPLMFSSTFEVPLDRATFTSRHSLDMNFLSCDERLVKKFLQMPCSTLHSGTLLIQSPMGHNKRGSFNKKTAHRAFVQARISRWS